VKILFVEKIKVHIFRIVDEEKLLECIRKKTRKFAIVEGRPVNYAYVLYNLIKEQEMWNRIALCVKLLTSLNALVPIPISYSREYLAFSSTLLRFKINNYIDIQSTYINLSELPKDQREILSEYMLIKRYVWKPSVRTLTKEKIVRGKHAVYVLQPRKLIIRVLSRNSLMFLRIVEKLLAPKRWNFKSLSTELYGSEENIKKLRSLLGILRAYNIIKYSKKYNSLVLNMSKAEIKYCLWRLHLKRCKLADRILSRLVYAMLREKGYTHTDALHEVCLYPIVSEERWLEERLSLRGISYPIVRELINGGYITEYEYELAHEYGII